MFLAAPAEIIGEGKVEQFKVELMELGEPDAKGRRKPIGTGKFETIPATAVISAIGQKIDLSGIADFETAKNGAVIVDKQSYQTSVPDVFAGGDVVTGPKFAIDAIAAGKEGSISIHRYVHPGQTQNHRPRQPRLQTARCLAPSPSPSAALTRLRARRLPKLRPPKQLKTFQRSARHSQRGADEEGDRAAASAAAAPSSTRISASAAASAPPSASLTLSALKRPWTTSALPITAPCSPQSRTHLRRSAVWQRKSSAASRNKAARCTRSA